jgi:hypothetical protein
VLTGRSKTGTSTSPARTVESALAPGRDYEHVPASEVVQSLGRAGDGRDAEVVGALDGRPISPW